MRIFLSLIALAVVTVILAQLSGWLAIIVGLGGIIAIGSYADVARAKAFLNDR